MSIRIIVNGDEKELEVGTLAELLAAIGIDLKARGTAVALNGRVYGKSRWTVTDVADGDRIEVIRAVSGG